MKKFLFFLLMTTTVTLSQTWQLKVSGSGLGNPLTYNPKNSDILYGSPGNTLIYVSRNRGYTWQIYGSAIPPVGVDPNIIKSIAINPVDTLQLLVGVESSGSALDRILKSTNGGVSWTQTWQGSFSYYGKPVEFKPIHPDTVYTMGDDTLWRSTDFGSTWDTLCVQRGTGHFNAWCDAEIRPDSSNILYVGDAATGIWKSIDYGAHWKQVYTAVANGEIPSIAIDPFDPRVAYASRFSGGGGLLKSTDWGETWQSIPTPILGSSSWWVTCSPVTPGYVYFGVYSINPGGIFVSADSGGSWVNYRNGLSANGMFNYGLMVLDTLTVIALQQTGINKLVYTPSLQVLSPNGGESFAPGVHHTISWSIDNLNYIRLQFSTDNGTNWTTLADSIPSSQKTFDWLVPQLASSQCRIRISDNQFTSTSDMSDTTFSIVPLEVFSPNGGEYFYSGASRIISWAAVDFPNVSLSYSIDSGTTWTYISQRPSTSNSYSWVVPSANSMRCKIKIADAGDSTVFDESDSVFTIASPASFHAALFIHDYGAQQDSMIFGAAAGATDGIDSSFGEVNLSPPPPKGTFDIRWMIPSANGSKIDYRDTLSLPDPQRIFTAEFQPGPGGYPMTLLWKPDSLVGGVYVLRDTLTHGGLLHIDMRSQNNVIIVDTNITAVEIVLCKAVGFTFPGTGGWSLYSLPVEPADFRTSSLFPYVSSSAFIYSGGYKSADTLRNGAGFWLKIQQTGIVGCAHPVDTIHLAPGWNMIGSVSSPVPISQITTQPESILVSNFFGYKNAYELVDTIDPGRGYWVKSKLSGNLFLSTSSQHPVSAAKSPWLTSSLHYLTVSDGGKNFQRLYFGTTNDEQMQDDWEMPPQPPAGGMDVRFSPNFIAKFHQKNLQNALEYRILVPDGLKKIFFSWGVENDENFTYILYHKAAGKTLYMKELSGEGSLYVERQNQSSFTLRVQQKTGSAEKPHEYSLGELFPNPFNPTTHINFSLPSDSYVTIKIYSLLGQEVTTLVDSKERAGMYNVEFNGSNLSSGIYFVRMIASPLETSRTQFVGVKKVVLLK